MTIEQCTQEVFKVVCTQFSVKEEEIVSTSRIQEVVEARDAIIYFLSKYLKLSTIKIGKIIKRDCGSVSYSLKKIEGKIDAGTRDKIFYYQICLCEKALKEVLNF